MTKQPDSEALRAKRYRAHRRGDHSLCRAGQCGVVSDDVRKFDPSAGETVTAAVLAFLDATPPASDNGPQVILARCALRLAEAIDGNPTGLPGHVRELNSIMAQLAETGDGEDELSEIRARRAARRAALFETH
ncbi:hypothetical protein ACWGQ5_34060 [Streptomyces sp. NPDC055722]